MPKIEPIETRHSIFDEPSNGSKYTMYFPCCSVSTSITVSFSSDTSKHVWNDDFSMFINSSFAMTSNFCCVSPWTFVKPEIPYLNTADVITNCIIMDIWKKEIKLYCTVTKTIVNLDCLQFSNSSFPDGSWHCFYCCHKSIQKSSEISCRIRMFALFVEDKSCQCHTIRINHLGLEVSTTKN